VPGRADFSKLESGFSRERLLTKEIGGRVADSRICRKDPKDRRFLTAEVAAAAGGPGAPREVTVSAVKNRRSLERRAVRAICRNPLSRSVFVG
jgi:hypothetical protein